jgi:hypothetical protein
MVLLFACGINIFAKQRQRECFFFVAELLNRCKFASLEDSGLAEQRVKQNTSLQICLTKI